MRPLRHEWQQAADRQICTNRDNIAELERRLHDLQEQVDALRVLHGEDLNDEQ